MQQVIHNLLNNAMKFTSQGSIGLSAGVVEGELRIEGRVPAPDGALVRAETLTAQILKAVIDDYDLRVDDGYARFSCTRRLPSD